MNKRSRSERDAGASERRRDALDARFAALYDRHYRSILAYCLRRLGPSGSRAASDVFLIARQRIGESPATDLAVLWLYRIALGVVTERLRAAPRIGPPARSNPRPGTGAGASAGRPSPADLATAAARRMGERDREVLRLATWERLPVPAIAFILGWSEAVTAQRLQRARDRLTREYDRLAARDQLREEQRGGGSGQ